MVLFNVIFRVIVPITVGKTDTRRELRRGRWACRKMRRTRKYVNRDLWPLRVAAQSAQRKPAHCQIAHLLRSCIVDVFAFRRSRVSYSARESCCRSDEVLTLRPLYV